MSQKPSSWILFAAFVVVVFLWGSSWLATKVILDQGMLPFTATAIRYILAALFMMIILFIRRQSLRIEKGFIRLILFHGLLMMAIPNALVFWGLQYVSSALSSIIFSVYPLLITLMSFILLKDERVTFLKVLGVFVGFVGASILFFDRELLSQSFSVLGMTALFVQVIIIAFATVMIKRDGQSVDPFLLNAGGMIVAAIALTLFLIPTEGFHLGSISAPALWSLLYLGFFASCLTFVVYFWLMKHVEIIKLSFTAYLTPIIGIVLGVGFYGESFRIQNIFGMLVIFAGIFIADLPLYVRYLAGNKKDVHHV